MFAQSSGKEVFNFIICKVISSSPQVLFIFEAAYFGNEWGHPKTSMSLIN